MRGRGLQRIGIQEPGWWWLAYTCYVHRSPGGSPGAKLGLGAGLMEAPSVWEARSEQPDERKLGSQGAGGLRRLPDPVQSLCGGRGGVGSVGLGWSGTDEVTALNKSSFGKSNQGPPQRSRAHL